MTRAQRRNRAKASAPAGTPVAEAAVERKPFKIAPELRALAKTTRKRPQAVQPFLAAQHPPEVTGGAKMAMDEASGVGDWAQAALGTYYGTYGNFPGFAQLAIQAQVPEIRRMVEIIATEATRKWIKIQASGADKGEKIKEIEAALDRFHVRDLFRRALEGDGYMGRGHLFVDLGATGSELATSIGDGADEASRAKVGKGKLKGFRIVDAMWAYPSGYNTQDPLASDWYLPTTWIVQGKPVHRTRLLTFVGREVPDLLKPAYSFGGISLSQLLKPTVDNWLKTRQNVSDLVRAFSVMVLATQMGNTLGVVDPSLMERVELFNDFRDNSGTFVLDKLTEDLKNVSAPLGTLDVLQAQSQEHIASVGGVPLVKFLGIGPAGLNASTDGEIRTFYDWIHAHPQEAQIRPHLATVISLIQLDLYGEVDPEITFAFEPLWSMSDKELAEVRKLEAETAQVYADTGVITPAEERKRLADDPESMYHGLDPDDVPDLEEEVGEGLEAGGENATQGLLGRVQERQEQRPALDRMFNLARDDWREGDHPRANNGQFGSGGGSSGSSHEDEPDDGDDEDGDDDAEPAEPYDIHHDEVIAPDGDEDEDHEAAIEAAIAQHDPSKIVLHAPLSFDENGDLDHSAVLAELQNSFEGHRNEPSFLSDDARDEDRASAHQAAEDYLNQYGHYLDDSQDGHHLVLALDRPEGASYWADREETEDRLRDEGHDDKAIEREISGEAGKEREAAARKAEAEASKARYRSTDQTLAEAYPAEMQEIEALRQNKDSRQVFIKRSELMKRYEAENGVKLSYDAASSAKGRTGLRKASGNARRRTKA